MARKKTVSVDSMVEEVQSDVIAEEVQVKKPSKKVEVKVNSIGEMVTKGDIYLGRAKKIKPEMNEKDGVISIYKNGELLREYTKEEHGRDYKNLAKSFMQKFTEKGL